MPAPAVIPALRAYINAVAVKGFVVELRTVPARAPSNPLGSGQALAVREHHRKRIHGNVPPNLRMQCMQGGARVFYCD